MTSTHATHPPHSLDTQFLSPQDVTAIVHAKGLVACLHGLADYLQADFLRWHAFDKSARLASHSFEGVIELMPIADGHTYAFKYVNGHPRNSDLGLPTVMAFGMLANVQTGVPELISELTLTTALRTAAMSVVAARLLARTDSVCMALIGNGAQSEFQALAFAHLMGIKTVRLFDIDPHATAKLMRNLQPRGLQVVPCASIAQAVAGADIVTTLTADKSHATILMPEMLEPGMHINGVGGDCPGKTELHPEVLRRASVFVEYEPQSRMEGDVQQMPPDFAVTELWQVLARQHVGRSSDQDITIFDSVGFALEDFSALRFMRDCARELGLGTRLPLIPRLDDPKDLFALITAVSPHAPHGHDLFYHASQPHAPAAALPK